MRIQEALAIVLAAAGMLSVASTDLEAQCDVSWANAVSGSWSVGPNWSTGTAPTAVQRVCIDALGAPYTVTLNVNATVAGFTLNSANATFAASGRTFVVNGPATLSDGLVLWSNSTWEGTGALNNSANMTFRETSRINSAFLQDGNVQVQGFAGHGKLIVADGFTNTGTITLTSTGNPSRNATLTVTNGTLTNTGTINTEVGVTGNRRIEANLTNDGTVNLNESTTFLRTNGSYTNNATFNIAVGKTLTISSAGQQFEQAAGRLMIDGRFDVSSSTLRFSGGTITGTATLSNAALNITATEEGRFVMRGLNNSFTGNIAAPQFVEIQGFSDHARMTAADGFTNAGTITLISRGNPSRNATLTVTNGTLTNTGTISADEGVTGNRRIDADLINAGSFTVTSPAVTLVVTGATFDNAAGGNVTGIGRIDVAGVSFTNNGDVSPGLSAGVLSFTGNYPQSSTGALNIEIGGTAPGTDFDVFQVSATATLDGRLNVDLIDGFLPTVGQTFRVMNYGSQTTGEFTDIVATAGGSELQDLTFVPIYSSDHLTLLVQGPITYAVNSTADPGDGVCDVAECTLREAINAANANPATDVIAFEIPGAGPHTIRPTSPLPEVTDPVLIDGFTQPNAAPSDGANSAVLLIELEGSLAGPTDGLSITAGNSTVRGLAIYGFDGDGIELSGEGGNAVAGNRIGTDIPGTVDVGNSQHGVNIDGSNNTVGGTAVGAGNVIAFNGEAGVFVADGSGSANTGNAVLSNSIFSNSGLGIDLSPAGFTLNDDGDGDSGPNDLQNFPLLASADLIASTTIAGTLDSTPNTFFRLEFFSNTACDPSGFGEGMSLLGAEEVTTDGNGRADFSFTFDATVPAGEFVSATATDPNNSTSEFSPCVEVVDEPSNSPPVAVAGDDQTVECTVLEGGQITLDASGSTDPDDNIAKFEWFSGDNLLATGETAEVTLPLGEHDIRLVVTDEGGLTATDDLKITVQDTKAPVLTILLEVVPELRGKFGVEEAAFRFVGLLAVDACDAEPIVSPVTLNGRELQPGDVFRLELDDDRRSERSVKSRKSRSDKSGKSRSGKSGSGKSGKSGSDKSGQSRSGRSNSAASATDAATNDNAIAARRGNRRGQSGFGRNGRGRGRDDAIRIAFSIEASEFILTATAEDASGNSATVEVAILLEDFAGAELSVREVVPGTETRRGTPVNSRAQRKFDRNLRRLRRQGFANPPGLPSALAGDGNPLASSLIGNTALGSLFDLSVAPDTLTVRRGESATYLVTLNHGGAFSDGEVSLSCADLPEGVTCAFSTEGISQGEGFTSAELTVSALDGSGSVAARAGQRVGALAFGDLWPSVGGSGVGRSGIGWSAVGHQRSASDRHPIGLGWIVLSLMLLSIVGLAHRQGWQPQWRSPALSLRAGLVLLAVGLSAGSAGGCSDQILGPGDAEVEAAVEPGTHTFTITATMGDVEVSETVTLIVR